MIRLFTIKNIPVEISLYGLIFMAIIVLPLTGSSLGGGNWILPVGLLLGIFLSILIHELAHALVGKAFGATVTGVQLNMLGGVTFFAQKPPSYFKDIVISLAGPLSNFILWKGFEATGQLLSGAFSSRLGVDAGLNLGAVSVTMQLGMVFWVLSQYNLVLAVLNALPAYPLDGGQTVYALVNWITRNDKFAAGLVLATSCLVVFDLLFNGYSPISGITGGLMLGGGLFTLCIAVWILISAFSLYNHATTLITFKPTTREVAEKRQAEDAKRAKTKKGYADFLKGKELMLAKNYNDAIGHLNLAVAADPQELDYIDYRAYTYADMGNYEAALQDYNVLVSKAPPFRLVDWLTQRAEVFIKLGNLDYARRDVVYALSINSAHYHAMKIKSDLEKLTGAPIQ